jgi:hypothetical protein
VLRTISHTFWVESFYFNTRSAFLYSVSWGFRLKGNCNIFSADFTLRQKGRWMSFRIDNRNEMCFTFFIVSGVHSVYHFTRSRSMWTPKMGFLLIFNWTTLSWGLMLYFTYLNTEPCGTVNCFAVPLYPIWPARALLPARTLLTLQLTAAIWERIRNANLIWNKQSTLNCKILCETHSHNDKLCLIKHLMSTQYVFTPKVGS